MAAAPVAVAPVVMQPLARLSTLTMQMFLLQLLWKVDQGNALDVSGVADTAMRERLVELFSNLPLERTKQVLRPVLERAVPSVLWSLRGTRILMQCVTRQG